MLTTPAYLWMGEKSGNRLQSCGSYQKFNVRHLISFMLSSRPLFLHPSKFDDTHELAASRENVLEFFCATEQRSPDRYFAQDAPGKHDFHLVLVFCLPGHLHEPGMR